MRSFSRYSSSRAFAAISQLLLLFYVSPAAGQRIFGVVRELTSGEPISGALVVLRSGGERVSGTISDADGRYSINAPAPGEYTVLVERIGIASTESTPFVLAAGERRQLELTAAVQATSLEGITATGRSRSCRMRTDHASEVQRVWDAARSALSATVMTRELSLVRWQAIDHLREIDPLTDAIRSDTSFVRPGYGTEAYVTVPGEELLERGFVWSQGDTTRYLIPDPAFLLSDGFLETHCFRLEAGEPGTIGLAFEPVRGRRLPDISGTMWLDVQTGYLGSMESRYVRTAR
jgi:hypothetical protein